MTDILNKYRVLNSQPVVPGDMDQCMIDITFSQSIVIAETLVKYFLCIKGRESIGRIVAMPIFFP
ncbi:hypothetical protein B1806_06665 [Metallibacterium scheffleri]|uniref:Uncharacterized protein n=1 Tax=Metallibacterium scheffleri TaxID=993689 RepID=A0A4S3KPB3_9GAMM|nr:hypothetical protein B1806_06665 [Metallibacterium scheffleri]